MEKKIKNTKRKDFLSQKNFNSPQEITDKTDFEVGIGAKIGQKQQKKKKKKSVKSLSVKPKLVQK